MLRGAVPGAGLALVLLVLINLFNYIDRQILAANIPNIEDRFLPESGTSAKYSWEEYIPFLPSGEVGNKTRLGYLTFAFMISYMVFAPLFGWLASYFPRWKLIGVGVIVWSLASGASGLAGTFLILLLTRCAVGIGEAAYGPVAPDVISDLYSVESRGKVMAWFYVAIPVGGALGYVIGGLGGFPMSFYLVVPPGILLGLWCFFMPEPRKGQLDLEPTATVQVRKPTFRDYFAIFKTPSYVLNTLGMTMLTFAIGGIAQWMPDYIHGYRDAGELSSVNITFGGIVVVSGLIATLSGGWAGDHFRKTYSGSYFLVSGIAMMLAFPAFLAVLWTPFPYAWVWIFVTCFLLFFNTGPTNTILANVTHPAVRAQAFAINIFVIHALGDAISPTVIGLIADRYAVDGKADMNAGFLAVSGMIFIGGVLWLIGVPFLGRDTERAPRSLDEIPIP